MAVPDWKREKKITTLEQFLDAMYSEHWAVSSELRWMSEKMYHDKSPRVIVYRDNNYSVDATTYDCTVEIAKEAVDRGLVTGRLKLGYTSTSEWSLSDEGRAKARELRKARYEVEKAQRDGAKTITVIEDTVFDEGQG